MIWEYVDSGASQLMIRSSELRRRPLRSNQRDENVAIDIGMKRMSSRSSDKTLFDTIPTWTCIPIFLAMCFLCIGTYYAYLALPTPVTLKTEAQHPNRFVAERAERWLQQIVDLGKRPAGGEANEIHAVKLLLDALNATAAEANAAHDVEIDLQVTSGEFYLGYRPYGMVTVYRSMQNIAARVTPSGVTPNHTLLVNCHYDSVEAGPGATDDALNCAVMLEAMRVVTKSSTTLRHGLVFLFNGAEENGLQASHGFITQHPWAKNVRAFINLEGAGSGGKEVMFQAGPEHPWLLDYYADVAPHPYAQAIGEELFQSGLIPSDTDFRIFRDFGHIPGMDFAHASNGYVYHTKHDTIDLIPLGTYQHTGDNLVALLNALGNAEELEDTAAYEDGDNVFFDVFGWFMIAYTDVSAIIINVFVILCTLITIGLALTRIVHDQDLTPGEISRDFGISILTQVGGWLLALVFAAMFAWTLDALDRPLSWYSRPWLLVGLYVVPTFLALATVSLLLLRFRKPKMTLGHYVQLQMHCLCVMLLFILTVLTAASVRSAYGILVPVLCYEISIAINVLTGFQNKVHKWLISHLVFQVPSVMFMMYLMITGLGVLVPIAGRSGPSMNPEYMIGIMTTFLTLVIGSFTIPLVSLLRQSRLVVVGLISIVVLFVVFVSTPLGFPYASYKSMPTPQRYWVFHSIRTLHNEDQSMRVQESGVFMLPMDRNSPDYIRDYVPQMKQAHGVDDWCRTDLYCGLPFYTSRMHKQSNYSHWVPMEPPKIPTDQEVKLELLEVTDVSSTVKRYQFKLDGPSHMGIYISPYARTNMTKWSFVDDIPVPGPMWGDRETYFIFYGYGLNKTSYNFHVDIEAESNWTGPRLDIAIAGHYMHTDVNDSKEFSIFLKSFPHWAHVSSWKSTYESWKY